MIEHKHCADCLTVLEITGVCEVKDGQWRGRIAGGKDEYVCNECSEKCEPSVGHIFLQYPFTAEAYETVMGIKPGTETARERIAGLDRLSRAAGKIADEFLDWNGLLEEAGRILRAEQGEPND